MEFYQVLLKLHRGHSVGKEVKSEILINFCVYNSYNRFQSLYFFLRFFIKALKSSIKKQYKSTSDDNYGIKTTVIL